MGYPELSFLDNKNILSPGEQQFVKSGLSQKNRIDWRTTLEFRPIRIELDVLRQFLSSSRVRIGSRCEATEIIINIKDSCE